MFGIRTHLICKPGKGLSERIVRKNMLRETGKIIAKVFMQVLG